MFLMKSCSLKHKQRLEKHSLCYNKEITKNMWLSISVWNSYSKQQHLLKLEYCSSIVFSKKSLNQTSYLRIFCADFLHSFYPLSTCLLTIHERCIYVCHLAIKIRTRKSTTLFINIMQLLIIRFTFYAKNVQR